MVVVIVYVNVAWHDYYPLVCGGKPKIRYSQVRDVYGWRCQLVCGY